MIRPDERFVVPRSLPDENWKMLPPLRPLTCAYTTRSGRRCDAIRLLGCARSEMVLGSKLFAPGPGRPRRCLNGAFLALLCAHLETRDSASEALRLYRFRRSRVTLLVPLVLSKFTSPRSHRGNDLWSPRCCRRLRSNRQDALRILQYSHGESTHNRESFRY